MTPQSVFGQIFVPILFTLVSSFVICGLKILVDFVNTRNDKREFKFRLSICGIAIVLLPVVFFTVLLTSLVFVNSYEPDSLERALSRTEERLRQDQVAFHSTQTEYAVEQTSSIFTREPVPEQDSNRAGETPGPTDADATVASATVNSECIETDSETTNVPSSQNIRVLYDFEQAEHQWNTSEEDYKLADLKLTDTVFHCGKQSLSLLTDLDATGEDFYRHTDLTAYFDRAIPLGFDEPGPYDFTGLFVSCYVLIPDDFPNDVGDIAEIKLSLKDRAFRNQQGEGTVITEDVIGNWIRLNLMVSRNGPQVDEGFNPREVNTLSVWIGTPFHSSLRARIQVFVDDCILAQEP